MAWWNKVFKREAQSPIGGQRYRVVCSVYSRDGKRAAEVRQFRHGKTYLVEKEWVEATIFKDRHPGRMVGPFASPKAAETFVVATAWFCGGDD